VADYNQIELRVIAHLSHDEGLLAAFVAGNDIHRAIAATVFHTSVDAVSSAQREFAKAVSYGLAYGMESFGLSQRLGVPVGEAKSIIDQYFAGFPALKAYMESCVADARERGYSRTEMGRIRHFEDLRLGNGPQKAAAERQAMNAGIQGMAADIFKLALVRIDNALLAQSLTSRLVLQVHDEVLVEAPEGEKAEVEALVREAMLGAARLSVPMEISLHWGLNWSEAKGK
jgi:DNA polymerase-1